MDISTVLPVLVRYAISALGTYLVTSGYFSEEQFATISDQALIIVGALIAIGPPIYSAWRKPSAPALEAARAIDKATKEGAAVDVKTQGGQIVASVPAK